MCGIFCHVSQVHDCEINEKCLNFLYRRGPDFRNSESFQFQEWNFKLISSVLWTQGSTVTKQPYCDSNKTSYLLWNGDIYYGIDFDLNNSDTEAVYKDIHLNGLISTISRVCGEYSFIYYCHKTSKLWFGRDPLGRQNLLWHYSTIDTNLILTSIGNQQMTLSEVPCLGIFCIDFKENFCIKEIELYKWKHLNMNKIDEFKTTCPLNVTINVNELNHEIDILKIESMPAYVNDEAIKYLLDVDVNITGEELFNSATQYNSIEEAINKLEDLLTESVRYRINCCPNKCKNCTNQLTKCSHTKIAILFSGGLDSTLLAIIAHNVLDIDEPIDLLNVAFDRQINKNSNFNVPDRVGGRMSLKELKVACPARIWNFVEINVAEEDLSTSRDDHIRDLIHPLESILDDSLGCAMWFATKGQGQINGQNYISPARIVLIGTGADEIFGGYSRHLSAFQNGSWPDLFKILHSDISNIGSRNMGRDNRVIADLGRQPRQPFLDEKFLTYCAKLHIVLRANLRLKRGIGDKLIMRLLARKLGLKFAAFRPKKAMQFGTKISKSKDKGHEISKNLRNSN